ncbi:LLM class flavin-dependent oxidoreductase [Niallia sp. 01092]|uniref:LLM class flavin-dependent oxidoreductase n=1 Tax=unclassified Niallia TaxID=2837522 RepID=UPI003FD4209E
MTIKLSILDQSPVGEKEKAEQGLLNTVRLAEAADDLGYHRFWVSEHHNSEEIAGSAPEVLIGYLLAKTKNIKIGSGGVMLQHYSPYKVAEAFHVLSSLAPNRVDLGIGKAQGGLNLSTKALQEDKKETQKSFEQKIKEVKNFISSEYNLSPAELKATPVPTVKPELYLLGGSVESAELAAKLGISYVFAFFINGEEAVLKEARARFQQLSPKDAKNTFILSTTIAVAEREEEALDYIKQKETIKVTFSNGKSLNVGTNEQAEKLINESEGLDYQIKVQKAGYIAGTKESVRKRIVQLSEQYEIDEIIALTPIEDIEKRIKSFRLLKEAIQTDIKLEIEGAEAI